MYLSDVRGFSVLPNIYIYTIPKEQLPSLPADTVFCTLCGGDVCCGTREPTDALRPVDRLTKCSIYGMGFCGAKGLTPYFARFCTQSRLSPRFISVSDMGISFFLPEEETTGLFDNLEKFFPI